MIVDHVGGEAAFDHELSLEMSRNNERFISRLKEYSRHSDFHPSDVFDPPGANKIVETSNWLASYRPMDARKSGDIFFNKNMLKGFTLFVIWELSNRGHLINKVAFGEIVKIIVRKSYYHALFYHYCDFNRIYTNDGAHYDFKTEKALAVAFSRHYIGKENYLLPLYSDLVEIAYQFQGKGYKDWVKYQNESAFLSTLVRYSGYLRTEKLQKEAGTNLVKICQSNLEAIANNPNVSIGMN